MTLVSDTAYHSFIGEVEALNTTTIRRLTPSRRHQLLAIALADTSWPIRGATLPYLATDIGDLKNLLIPDLGAERCHLHF
jgi:hypothetical protein